MMHDELVAEAAGCGHILVGAAVARQALSVLRIMGRDKDPHLKAGRLLTLARRIEEGLAAARLAELAAVQ